MEGPSPKIPTFRFSTCDLPERDRIPVTCEVLGRLIVRADFEPTQNEPFHCQIVARALPGLAISTFSVSSGTVRRTRELLADGNDDVALTVSLAGGIMFSQAGREVVTGAGDAVAFSMADLTMCRAVSRRLSLSLRLRHRVLATLVPDIEDHFLRPIRGGNGALNLLTRYVGLFDEPQALTTPELRRAAVDHVYDLAALALGATSDAAERAKNGGLRAARLHAIKTDILNGLNRHDLSLAGLAARHRVTPRYVQMLFESEGTTFSRFLLDQRLARAHRMLSHSRMEERTISAIAYEAGFGDVSNFNRMFRRRYGETPSDLRGTVRRS